METNVKQQINDYVCESRGVRRGVDEGLERMYYRLSDALKLMEKFELEDINIGGNDNGVCRELKFTVRMLDAYCEDFHEILGKYITLEEKWVLKHD